MICSYCSVNNLDTVAFCWNCGRPLRMMQQDTSSPPFPAAQQRATQVPSPRFPAAQQRVGQAPSAPFQSSPREAPVPGKTLVPVASPARSPQPSRTTGRKSGSPGWPLLLLGGILLLALIGGGTMFFLSHSFATTTDPVIQTLTNYCNALKKSDYQSAWSLWSSDMHNQMKEADYAYSWQLKGKVTSCTVNATVTNPSSCTSTLCSETITYFLNNGHTTQSVTDTLQLLNENDQWKIQSENPSS